nr:protein-L-isoaspartate(D-aspartate) O-methyltransferase (PCMT) [uncultured bacterium]
MNGQHRAIFVSAGMDAFVIARANMIESQVRPNGVTDPRVIEAMAQVPREKFLPDAVRDLAYIDADVSLRPGRYLMEPMALARLLQLAAITAEDHVLHIGCGMGYGTAILARLARTVVAIDEDPEFVALAGANAAYPNVTVLAAPHAAGLPAEGPYDVIVVDGRIPAAPQNLLAQLNDKGRLVAVVGGQGTASGKLFRKHGNSVSERSAFDASVPILPGFIVERPGFTF